MNPLDHAWEQTEQIRDDILMHHVCGRAAAGLVMIVCATGVTVYNGEPSVLSQKSLADIRIVSLHDRCGITLEAHMTPAKTYKFHMRRHLVPSLAECVVPVLDWCWHCVILEDCSPLPVTRSCRLQS